MARALTLTTGVPRMLSAPGVAAGTAIRAMRRQCPVAADVPFAPARRSHDDADVANTPPAAAAAADR